MAIETGAPSVGALYRADALKRFRDTKKQADGALSQVPYERWQERLDAGSNSLVTLMLHISGNQLSRWTDFLDSDGEKPTRDRDAEFEDGELTREALVERWEQGWDTLFAAIESLGESDLVRTVTIRKEPHFVVEAINRQIAHYALHVGQMLFLAKHLAGESWRSQSIPRRGSAEK
ncbi:MAG TPA: DUF1572 family protein [Vicinamibacteria bacterium]|nr:DUF1572 family protein [Vicinamibacteria bacterium]